MWKALSFSFNKKLSPLVTITGFLILNVINTIGLGLDHIFFPGFRKKSISKPLVIVGNPRSGTTFIQRFLVKNGLGTGMRIWKMLYPSLTFQTLIKPFLPIMEKVSPARHHSSVIHETSLNGIETDDPALLFRYFDGFFVYGFFLAWAEEDLKDMFDPKNRDTSERDFSYLRKIWKRNLVGEKEDRMVPKIFSLSVRIPQFLKQFPDAKILYLVRDPLSTVPSGLSLVTGVLDNRFGFWNLSDEKRQKYIERLYNGLLELSLTFHEHYVSGTIPKESIKIVQYDRMMKDFDNLMEEILEFAEESPGEDFKQIINETSAKQKAYKSEHKYDLDKFGLTEEKIRKDYAPIYDAFLS
jgi:hypothetical protein